MAIYRMQILLKPEQRERLERVAKREGRTFSDTARRAIEEGLRVMEGDADSIGDRRLEKEQLSMPTFAYSDAAAKNWLSWTSERVTLYAPLLWE